MVERLKRVAGMALVLLVLGGVGPLVLVDPGTAATHAGDANRADGPERARLCFPAALWNAPDHERPCYRIDRPYEDGSGRLVIKADTIRADCAIPNVHEEPSQFAIHCAARGPGVPPPARRADPQKGGGGTSRLRRVMDDLGTPGSYLTLGPQTPVYSSDGELLGEVEHVLADGEVDIFDGIVIDRSVLPGGHRFADASQVAEIYERGVVLTVDAAGAERLPEPSPSPAAMEVTGEDFVEREWDDEIEVKLKRAWDVISGKG